MTNLCKNLHLCQILITWIAEIKSAYLHAWLSIFSPYLFLFPVYVAFFVGVAEFPLREKIRELKGGKKMLEKCQKMLKRTEICVCFYT